MTDADALLAAVRAHPDDDTARLVYADWLDEHGRGHEAEFVRVQCRLAAADPGDPDYPALLDRDEELRLWLHAHAPARRVPLPGGLYVDAGRWWQQAHRGFPRFLEFDGLDRPGAGAMRRLGAALERAFARVPTRWLALRFVSAAQVAALLRHPAVGRLSHLTVQLAVTGDEGADVARSLAACRHLANLKGLLLYFPFGDAGCEALAGGPWDRLEWFASPLAGASGAGVRALAAAGWFRGLRELTLSDDLPAEVFDALVRLPPFPRLHTLDLSHNRFLLPAWEQFGRAVAFPALKRLDLGGGDLSGGRFAPVAAAAGFALSVLNAWRCATGPDTGARLAAAPWAASLRVLGLGFNGLSPAVVRALAGSPRLAGLRHLHLNGNPVGATGLAAVAAAPALRGLRALDVSGGPGSNRGLTPAHLDRFLDRLDMPELRHLDLSGRPVGGAAARRLTGPKFAALRRLVLGTCRLTDAAAAKLVTAPPLQNLIQLDLSLNGLTTGVQALADPAVLPQLASGYLYGNRVPATAARKLRKRPGITGL